ncbi:MULTISPECIES: hypothetical protein [unclassified Mesorhizobium]|uniref:hypothetical protein n=1 Tax=unclassified Mesorhizobium TaxID=325217 RepID=UPI000FCA88E5|nr:MULTISPECIES: hypothetical protein [unclassified Mesorhizobium]RUV27069.1 hypothetical protein EOA91_02120 [Mesorhizobium sp. M1A.F.Ca.IN.022.04.1.1]RWG35550.1 MAG: hypothetical protein EOQ60_06480 [Mesorhizobium sp.]TIS17796.1 MAG: hypothetical protein E5X10_02135 [Mesorhizobium sp.]
MTGTLRDRQVRDSLMGSGQMKSMLADVVEARSYIDALIGLIMMKLYRLKGCPGPIPGGEIYALLIEREAEHTLLASEYMY